MKKAIGKIVNDSVDMKKKFVNEIEIQLKQHEKLSKSQPIQNIKPIWNLTKIT